MSDSPETISCRAIGVVHTETADAEVPRRRRDMIADIEIFPAFRAGLAGIEAYSHLFVLFWMHRAPPADALTCHPRGDDSLPPTGVFAARGRNHPNPIGLAVAELVAVTDRGLRVRRVDAYDGTPVIDIKPYDDYDVVSDPRVPRWFEQRARRRT